MGYLEQDHPALVEQIERPLLWESPYRASSPRRFSADLRHGARSEPARLFRCHRSPRRMIIDGGVMIGPVLIVRRRLAAVSAPRQHFMAEPQG